ncbi:hypothetical protein AMTRI_Chr10g3320 [Amborella trichopoda]|uniref:lysM domain receptor-like kinase 3 isoform X2 n=1 Tax=Amborella trichopoda TaxID=13333 RepID=UPI0005D3AD1C|nr:lysM domain receptor-like kinase 3 isoform X2 [Amborella trichopoda]|eukprot:XP_011625141.1 lysM domain receptor-like kinase 3 isoform X2 [Amborella trichopoda]
MGMNSFCELGLLLALLCSFCWVTTVAQCKTGCDLAFGSYYITQGQIFGNISVLFDGISFVDIQQYNPEASSQDSILFDTRLNITFTCDCNDGILGHTFRYPLKRGDTYNGVARTYANLTDVTWLQAVNSYAPTEIPDNGSLNVTVNCSCGDADISRDYGLFLTYPLRQGENLSGLASAFNISSSLLQRYNPNANYNSGRHLVFIPFKDSSGSYRPLQLSNGGIPAGAVVGIVVAGIAAMSILVICYFMVYKRKKTKASLLSSPFEDAPINDSPYPGSLNAYDKSTESVTVVGGVPPGLTGLTVDKSLEFSYEELASATNGFSMANKIGEGGFGSVYYAELRGERAAIKKMDMQASREFLAELKVLTRVHHLNLVRLIGFCTETCLFLVYEFIENGNISQHLRGSDGREPLPWSARLQIALDSARGLEYIHEHTVPVYIHRDIKSANILIDKNFRGKVADFGLTKLTEVGSSSLPTRLVGTFGYMPPEYAQFGDVSPKVDVYAFGVVLYELISAKEAVVKTGGSVTESKGLVALFESILNEPDAREKLYELVDPRLGDNYPLDPVYKMAQLAKACTQENPQLRPSMRSIVVALMTLSSSTEDWDVGSLYENQALVNLMSGR